MAKTPTPEERVHAHMADVKQSLEKHGLNMCFVVEFPNQPKVPRIARFCTWLVNRYGGRIAIKYQLVDGTITSKSKPRRT